MRNRQRRRKIAARPLEAFMRRVAREVPGPRPSTVTVCLVSDRIMRDLNRTWRGRAATTDVLSFPGGESEGPGGPVHVGDIVISVERTREQARRAGRSPSEELRVLLIHGWLHLLGFDHETDDGEMMRLQRRLERRLLRGRGAAA